MLDAQVVVGVEPNGTEESDTDRERRESLQQAVDKYIEDHYLEGLGTVYPSRENSDEFVVCIAASKFNERNFWSGRWRAVFRVAFDADDKAKVSGSMKVNVHYYESGNVQLNTSRDHGEAVSGADIASEVVKVIKRVEGEFQSEIDSACNNLSDTFKSLRRRLPITGSLFDFASGQHKVAQEITGK